MLANWLYIFNQSVNQSAFYSANIPHEARLSGATAESVFNSNINETVTQHERAIRCAGVYGREAKSMRCALRCFLKVATEVAAWTDSGRLFQREAGARLKSSCICVGLNPGD